MIIPKILLYILNYIQGHITSLVPESAACRGSLRFCKHVIHVHVEKIYGCWASEWGLSFSPLFISFQTLIFLNIIDVLENVDICFVILSFFFFRFMVLFLFLTRYLASFQSPRTWTHNESSRFLECKKTTRKPIKLVETYEFET